MSDLRMPDLNKTFTAGRLTRNPEEREAGQSKVCSFGIAHNKKYKVGDEMREKVTFVDVQTWNKSGEWVMKNCIKGTPVLIEGSLQSDQWEQDDGQKRSKVYIDAVRVSRLDWDESGDKPDKPAPQVEIPI